MEQAAQRVLDALSSAHTMLATAVDQCATASRPCPDDRARVEHLFALYEQLTAPLLPAAAKPKRVARKHPVPATAPAPYPTSPPPDATQHFHVMEQSPPYRTGNDT